MKTLVTLFGALSDPSRLRILNLLLESGDLCVCDIERTLNFTQTKVSRHMRYLRRAGLVRARKSGRWVVYSLGRPKSAERGSVLSSLRSILITNAAARADRAALIADMKKGCCVGPRILGRRLPPSTPTTRKEVVWNMTSGKRSSTVIPTSRSAGAGRAVVRKMRGGRKKQPAPGRWRGN
ncbi:MAG TPA: metalloregulator ArsR/SmtB family transcription factor [Bacteroidota bacterium]|nr:metalloregulator ArsR/SmtB family transcription factor [Bacteroidota bacterium]